MNKASTVLNVDDNEPGRYARSRVLQLAGFQVREAASGEQALLLAGETDPDLVLLDLQLPDIDGFEVCRRIKAARSSTQVLHISAVFRDPRATVLAHESGADAFLNEPVAPEVLVATARTLLRAKAAADELSAVKEELEAQLGRMTRLHELTSRLSAGSQLEPLFEEILAAVAELQGTSTATLLLWDATRGALDVVASVGFRDERAQVIQRIPVGFGCAGRAVLDRGPVVVEDTEIDSRYTALRWVARQAGYRAIYAIPLLARSGEVLGAIATMFPAPHRPSARDIEMAELYAREAAGAIEHARDLDRHAATRRELEALLARTHEQAELINLSHDAIITTDAARIITTWNAGAVELYGWTAAEAVGRNADLLLRAEGASPAELARTGRWDGELAHIGRDGRSIFVESRQVLLRAGDGAPARILEINRDITERWRVEEELRRKERRFRATFDHAGIGIAHLGLDGRWLRVNPKLLEILGYSEAELTRLKFQDVTRPDDLETDLEMFRRLAAGEIDNYSLEKRYRRRSGELVWLHLSLSILRGADGRPEHFIAILEDIHKRKLAEEALRESEAAIRSFYHSAPMLMGVVEIAAHDILHVSDNPAAAQFFGVERTQNRWSSEMGVPQPVIEEWLGHYRESRRRGGPVQFEFRYERGGAARCAWVTVSFIETRPNGRPCFSYVSEDVTERKRAESELIYQFRVMEEIAQHAAAALVVLDAQGRIRFLNPGAERMFGYQRQELLGRVLHDTIHYRRPDGAPYPVEECPVAGVFVSGRPIDAIEEVFYRKDGTPVVAGCSNAPILRDGEVAGSVLVMHDISERKRSEEQLRQAQKLESIGQLAGGLAHDFNNILTAIIGNASFAAELIPEENPARKMTEAVVQHSERAADLVRQMLAYAGKGRFVLERVDLSQAVRGIAELLASSVSRKLELGLDLDPALPLIEADPGQIQQVVMNLAINAAEALAGRKDGRIAVTTRVFSLSDGESRRDFWGREILPGAYVSVEVSDNGPGIDPEAMPRIFDPFFSTKFLGRGLGLAAVAGIVRSHHGFLEIRTQPGQGSTFTVFFPAIAAPPAQVEARPSAETGLCGAGTVLVADDEESIRDLVTSVLQPLGYSVVPAADGSQALDILTRDQVSIDLVLLDMSMPVMDGADFLAQAAALEPCPKVLLTSGYSDAGRPAPTGVQPAGFLQKPYTAEELAAKVKELLA